MQQTWAILIIGSILLAGCSGTSGGDSIEEPPSPEPAEANHNETIVINNTIAEEHQTVVQSIVPQEVQFEVNTELDGALTIAGTAWMPEEAETLVVFIHGFYGTRQNYWHTLPEANYSMPAGIAKQGRAALSLDMPSYGQSGGTPEFSTFDVMGNITDQIVAQIQQNGLGARAEPFNATVGYGLSMGGFVVNIMQGQHATFDAIIPTSAPHLGAHSHTAICLYGGIPNYPDCPPTWEEFDFVMSNADPDVVAATLAGYEDINKHGRQANEFVRWWGVCIVGEEACVAQSPYDEVTAPIDVPVLALLGINDTAFSGTEWEQEPDFYPNSPDARSHGFPDVGHFIHNHKIQPELLEMVDQFLTSHNI